MKIAISSGHSTKCQGMVGPEPWGLNEVEEATRVVDRVAQLLSDMGVEAPAFHDTVSTDKSECLNRIVDWHNTRGPHELDVSVHFNASQITENPVGTEVWYTSTSGLEYADPVVDAIAAAGGLKNRGVKQSDDLFFLGHTAEPAILIEVAFGDSHRDCDLYRQNFEPICRAIASALAGDEPATAPPPDEDFLFHAKGKCSYFGGPGDTTGMDADEPLAFIYTVGEVPHLFMPTSDLDDEALGQELNPYVHYLACRWDYSVTSKEMLKKSGEVALVTATKTGRSLTAIPADWGPHSDTGRVADLSPGLMSDLGIETDDEVTVVYPYRE
jgi:hypothetical protein